MGRRREGLISEDEMHLSIKCGGEREGVASERYCEKEEHFVFKLW